MMTEYKILALDVATKTGYVCDQAHGVKDFALKKDESAGMKLINLNIWLDEVVSKYHIDLLVFERTAGRFKQALIHQSEMHGVIKHFCESKGVAYTAFSASEIKKHATAKGNASKNDMIYAAEQSFKLSIIDDNHADALWIYDLACSKYKQFNRYKKPTKLKDDFK